MPNRQRGDKFAVSIGDRIRYNNQAAIRVAGERIDRPLDLGGIAYRGRSRRHADRCRHTLDDVNRAFVALSGVIITDTRVTPGAISFSSSRYFPPIAFS